MDNSFWVNYGEYIVGIPALVISTVVAVWVFVRQKNKKKFSYRILTKENLLSYSKEIEGKLTIHFENKEIESLQLLKIEFINNGNMSILPNDFVTPLQIFFIQPIDILNIEVDSKTPDSLEINFEIGKNSIKILPNLFNSGDKVSLKVLISGASSDFSIMSRIVGISEIEEIKYLKKGSVLLLFLIVFIPVCIFIVYIFWRFGTIELMFLILIILFVLFTAFLWHKENKNIDDSMYYNTSENYKHKSFYQKKNNKF